ncbi:hypothetical protein H4R24_002340 [Coemansia sp. RSA 988]|nr:hypothetical protein H4R24_002340 [Coemansia sp. RSA 988]
MRLNLVLTQSIASRSTLKTASLHAHHYKYREIATRNGFASIKRRYQSTQTTTLSDIDSSNVVKKAQIWESKLIYEGGLTKAAKIMKLASIASLVGASAAIPFFFTEYSDVPTTARTVLALTTMGMTGSSTAMVAWALRPYITSLHVLQNANVSEENVRESIGLHTPLLVETMTLLAQPRTRLVFPAQLASSTLPMSSWVVRESDSALSAAAKRILDQINSSRTGKLVEAAKPGDLFFAHTHGELSAEMKQIVAAAPGQD